MAKWLSEAEFRKKAFELPKPGPVHYVSGAASPTQNLIDAAEASEHAAAHPALRCPCCGEVAADIAGATQLYQLDVAEGGGKSHKADIPPCPVSGLNLPAMAYTVEPCGCRVSSDWAGGFSRELLSRANGGVPKPLVDLTDQQRAEKIAHYGDRLKALYALQAVANPPETKAAVDYWIVVCADQLQRLAPSGHNRKPPAKPLEAKVADWADKNGFTTPPEPTPVQEGVPVYRQANGTVGLTPTYAGQEPCGFTSAPSTPKVEFGPVGGEEAFQAALAAAQIGAVGTKDLMKLAGIAPPDEPELSTTRSGQFAVRYGDIYKVFTNHGEAKAYAEQLKQVTPGFAAKMKPLQTLPVEEKVDKLAALKKVLLAASPSEIPQKLAQQVLGYTYAHMKLTHEIVTETFGLASPVDVATRTVAIRDSLIGYTQGINDTLTADAFRFVKAFVNMVDIPETPDAPARVAAPDPVTAAPPKPAVERHAKKKRTIRKIQD
jgi:hypothetical protein